MTDYIDWANEPDLDRLRMLVALLARSPSEALPGLEVLAERGSVASTIRLAYFYLGGGPSSYLDVGKAKFWYSRAQEKGNPEAAYMLGRLHYKSGDCNLAFASFLKGTEIGYPPAIFRLAGMYRLGEGTTKSISEYKRLLELAHSKKHIVAKRDLARLLVTGRFGLAAKVRGALMYVSLWGDVGYLVRKLLTPGSKPDERILT